MALHPFPQGQGGDSVSRVVTGSSALFPQPVGRGVLCFASWKSSSLADASPPSCLAHTWTARTTYDVAEACALGRCAMKDESRANRKLGCRNGEKRQSGQARGGGVLSLAKYLQILGQNFNIVHGSLRYMLIIRYLQGTNSSPNTSERYTKSQRITSPIAN